MTTAEKIIVMERWIVIQNATASEVAGTFVLEAIAQHDKKTACVFVDDLAAIPRDTLASYPAEKLVQYRYHATRVELETAAASAGDLPASDIASTSEAAAVAVALAKSYKDVLSDPTRTPGLKESWPPIISKLAETGNVRCFSKNRDPIGVIIASPGIGELGDKQVMTTNWVWTDPVAAKDDRNKVHWLMRQWLLTLPIDHYRASVNLFNDRSAKFHEKLGYKKKCLLVLDYP